LGGIATLEVLEPGPRTTVQDLGRYGFGRYGVPPSGALDAFALRAANLLVGNPEGEAGLEITVMGLKVRALSSSAVAIGGGDLHPVINQRPVETWRSYIMKKDDILHFKGRRNGCRAYLALGGGILCPSVLKSKSTNLSSGFGGYRGRALKKGDILFSEAPHTHLRTGGRVLGPQSMPFSLEEWTLRILFGPQDGDFREEAKSIFLGSSFMVSPLSDRTGVRLSGPSILRKVGMAESIISEGVVPGTIQIPGDGQPIIILAETITGGYRKIATVITADLSFLGQIMPGDRVKFREVAMDEALSALEDLEGIIKGFKQKLDLDSA
jgi:antagonist of KipI